MLDLLRMLNQQEPLASGAVILRRFAFDSAPTLLQAIAAVARQSPFLSDGNARRLYDVGGNDQLRPSGLDDGSAWLSLFSV